MPSIALPAGTVGKVEEELYARRAGFALVSARLVAAAGAFIAASLLAMWWFLLPAYTQLPWTAGVFVFLSGGSVAYFVLRRLGLLHLATYLLLAVFLLACIGTYFFLPEIGPAIVNGYIVTIITGYLLLGRRGSWLAGAAIAGVCADLALNHFVTRRFFAPLDPGSAWIIGIVVMLPAMLTVALVVRAVVLGQEEFFRLSRLANVEIELRMASEQEQRQLLEEAKAEIEQRAVADREQHAALQELFGRVRQVAGKLSQAAVEILTATGQQAAGASEQSAAISQASATISQVRDIAAQTAERAQGVAAEARHTADVSGAGQQAVDLTTQGMGQVKQKVEKIATDILVLSEHTQTIGQITAAVGEIAAQSNILALNAAVEAARAGEAGKGFAVVAGEVRSLADQSRAATGQIREILAEIQGGVNTAVMATEEGMKGADAGVRLVGEAGEAIRRLAESVDGTAYAAAQIAAAAGQQMTGMTQIAEAIQSIQQVTGQTALSAQQTAAAAAGLHDLSLQLRELVADGNDRDPV